MTQISKDNSGTVITTDGIGFYLQFADGETPVSFHMSQDTDGVLFLGEDLLCKEIGGNTLSLWNFAVSHNCTHMYGTTIMESESKDGGVAVTKIKTVALGLALAWLAHEVGFSNDKNVKYRSGTLIAKLAAFHLRSVYGELHEDAFGSGPRDDGTDRKGAIA